MDELLSSTDLAEYLHVPVEAIYRWRMRGAGPRAITVANRRTRYRRSDVEAWLDAQADGPVMASRPTA